MAVQLFLFYLDPYVFTILSSILQNKHLYLIKRLTEYNM